MPSLQHWCVSLWCVQKHHVCLAVSVCGINVLLWGGGGGVPSLQHWCVSLWCVQKHHVCLAVSMCGINVLLWGGGGCHLCSTDVFCCGVCRNIMFVSLFQCVALMYCCGGGGGVPSLQHWCVSLWCVQKRRYLLKLRDNLPSMSPISPDWPASPKRFRATSEELRKLFHRWRVGKAAGLAGVGLKGTGVPVHLSRFSWLQTCLV